MFKGLIFVQNLFDWLISMCSGVYLIDWLGCVQSLFDWLISMCSGVYLIDWLGCVQGF